MNRTIKEALRIAQSPKNAVRFHHTIARHGYATDGAVVSTGEPNSLPEKPQTIAMQLRQLVDGKRAGVFVANGSKHVSAPKGVSVVPIKEGHIFFNPEVISRSDVLNLTKNGRINEILGYVQSKKEAISDAFTNGQWPVGVVSRDKNGVEQDSAMVGPGKEEEQAQVFADRAQEGSTVGLEDVGNIIADRMGFADGGVPEEESQEEFLKKELEGSAPQYDPEAGMLTGKRAGLMAAGFAPGSGIASAAGKFPTAEGGYEPSLREDIKEHRYGSAFLKALGAAGDVAYAAPVVGTAVGAAMKAPLAAKLVMAAAPVAKAAHEIAPVAKAAEEAAPVAKVVEEVPTGFKVDNPGGSWLEEKQKNAFHDRHSTGEKGLSGSATGYAGMNENELYLPVSELSKLKGVNNETPAPGKIKYDELAKSVEKHGYTNENPVMVFVNHKGQAYLNEGNNRVAVARDKNIPSIRAQVHWFNGAEDVPGEWSPSSVAKMEKGSEIGKSEPASEAPVTPQRVTNPIGMYSHAAEAARALPQEKGTPQQMIASLKGIKPEELHWSGVHKAFEGRPTITREELAQHFEENLPQVEEKILRQTEPHVVQNEDEPHIYNVYKADDPEGRYYGTLGEIIHDPDGQYRVNTPDIAYRKFQTLEQAKDYINRNSTIGYETEYSDDAYRLPEGENYREILMHLPSGQFKTYEYEWFDPKTQTSQRFSTEKEAKASAPKGAAISRVEKETLNPHYTSSHFPQTRLPNLLAWIRAVDRTIEVPPHVQSDIMQRISFANKNAPIRDLASGAPAVAVKEGFITPEEAASISRIRGWRNEFFDKPGLDKKVFHMDELQSEYAKNARKKGFAKQTLTPEEEEEYRNLHKRSWDPEGKLTDQEAARHEELFQRRHQSFPENHGQIVVGDNIEGYGHVRAIRNTPEGREFDVGGLWIKDSDFPIDRVSERKTSNIPANPYIAGAENKPSNSWVSMALRNALRHAAEGGYDRFVWTPGQEQALRWNEANYVNDLYYNPNHRYLHGTEDGFQRFEHNNVDPEDLPGLIGDDLAKQLLAEVDNRTSALNEYDVVKDPETGKFNLELYGEPLYDYGGDILEFDSKHDAKMHISELVDEEMDSNPPSISVNDVVGGQGKKQFYDKMVAKELSDILKKLKVDAKVNMFGHELPAGESGVPVMGHYVDLSPETRAAILRGFPAYKRGGSVGQKDASFLSKLAYNPRGNRRIREALSLSRKITEG